MIDPPAAAFAHKVIDRRQIPRQQGTVGIGKFRNNNDVVFGEPRCGHFAIGIGVIHFKSRRMPGADQFKTPGEIVIGDEKDSRIGCL